MWPLSLIRLLFANANMGLGDGARQKMRGINTEGTEEAQGFTEERRGSQA